LLLITGSDFKSSCQFKDEKLAFRFEFILINFIESYDQVGQQFPGGGLDDSRKHSDGLNGLFTGKTALKDPIADDHHRRVGTSQDQSIDNNLAVE
jgi:hypothetical protein